MGYDQYIMKHHEAIGYVNEGGNRVCLTGVF